MTSTAPQPAALTDGCSIVIQNSTSSYNSYVISSNTSSKAICGDLNSNTIGCINIGSCSIDFNSTSGSVKLSTVGSNSSLCVYQLLKVIISTSGTISLAKDGTVIKYGDPFIISYSYGSSTYGWQPGPCILTCSNIIGLTEYSSTSISEYQVWAFVNPVNLSGIVSTKGIINVTNTSVLYGSTTYIQSYGKSAGNSNYQFASVGNNYYKCLLIASPGNSSGPNNANGYNMFIPLNTSGSITNIDGSTTVAPIGSYYDNGGLGTQSITYSTPSTNPSSTPSSTPSTNPSSTPSTTPPSLTVPANILSGSTITVQNVIITNTVFTVNVNNNDGIPCGGSGATNCMGVINQPTNPPVNSIDIGSAASNQTITNFFLNAVTTSDNKKYTIAPTGTPITYGQYVVIQDVTQLNAWQTGPCSFSGGCNDVITFNPYDNTNNYQVWVLVDPITGNGIYNGKANGSPITSIPVPFGATCYIQSVGKQDDNNKYQYGIANESGYKALVATYSNSTSNNLPSGNNIGPATMVLLGGDGSIPYADGSSVTAPTSYTPNTGGTYGGTQTGPSANPSTPIIIPPIVTPANVPPTPLTTDQQLIYDGSSSASTLRTLLGYYLIFAIIIVVVALIFRVIMEIYKSSKKEKAEEQKTELTNETSALAKLVPPT